jgi:hypothetical protein
MSNCYYSNEHSIEARFIISGVHLNLSSKLALEKRLSTHHFVSLQSKNTNNAKNEVRFKQLIIIRGAFTIDSSTPTLRINLNEHPIFLVMKV